MKRKLLVCLLICLMLLASTQILIAADFKVVPPSDTPNTAHGTLDAEPLHVVGFVGVSQCYKWFGKIAGYSTTHAGDIIEVIEVHSNFTRTLNGNFYYISGASDVNYYSNLAHAQHDSVNPEKGALYRVYAAHRATHEGMTSTIYSSDNYQN